MREGETTRVREMVQVTSRAGLDNRRPTAHDRVPREQRKQYASDGHAPRDDRQPDGHPRAQRLRRRATGAASPTEDTSPRLPRTVSAARPRRIDATEGRSSSTMPSKGARVGHQRARVASQRTSSRSMKRPGKARQLARVTGAAQASESRCSKRSRGASQASRAGCCQCRPHAALASAAQRVAGVAAADAVGDACEQAPA